MGESFTCKNCSSIQTGSYCNNCGQKARIERYTVKRFFSIIFDAFNIKRGILYTFKTLLRNPGKAINEYLGGRTVSYFNPLNYLIIAAGIYAVLVLWLDIFDSSIEATNSLVNTESMQDNDEILQMQSRFSESMKGIINLIPLFLIPFASLMSRWFYRTRKLFYGEHLIINSFLFAQGFYLSLFFIPIVIFFPGLKVFYGAFVGLIMIVYLSYSMHSIHKGTRIRNILGSLVIYLGGMLFFYLFIIIVFILLAIVLSLLGQNILDMLQ